MADLDVVRPQNVGGFEKFLALDVGGFFFFAVEEPASEKFQLDVLDAVVVEDLLHFLQAALLERVGKIGVPNAQAIEAHARGGFGAVLDIPRTIFMIGVRFSAAPRESPIRAEQVHICRHL